MLHERWGVTRSSESSIAKIEPSYRYRFESTLVSLYGYTVSYRYTYTGMTNMLLRLLTPPS